MTPEGALQRLLGRPEANYPIPALAGAHILVTGHKGTVGQALVPLLQAAGADVLGVDLPEYDVTQRRTHQIVRRLKPDIIYHLAADKHAPACEYQPYAAQRVNTDGTERMLTAIQHRRQARLILASTCKAIVPETCYGASKLVAERMTLNEAGIVGRLYNVWPSHGNVLELWERQYGQTGTILVTDCWRYAITINECATFMASLATAPRTQRYSPYPGDAMHMPDVAARWRDIFHPDAKIEPAERRRGDRAREPLFGPHETAEPDDAGRLVVRSEHDSAGHEQPTLTHVAV